MTLVTIQDYPVHNKYWYIVDFRNLTNVKLLPHYYVNSKAAKRSIKLNFLGKRKTRYKVMKGTEVKEFFLNYLMSEGTGHFNKYQYPIFKITNQDKKSFRTVIRRRLRRMGLYTKVKPKLRIKDKPQYVKPIEHKQKTVMNGYNTWRVIQIERKPSKYWYLVITKELSHDKGKLFKLKALRFNNKTGELKQVHLHTLRTDVIIPYMLTTLKEMIHEKLQQGKKTKAYYKRIEHSTNIGLAESKRKSVKFF